jgi:hypothetical protein
MQYIPVEEHVDPNYLRPCFSLRSRREINTVDQLNARISESWQNTHVGTNRTPYMDMKPSMSRIDTRDKRGAVAYMPGIDKSLNGPYFNQYDAKTDPINVARELEAAVYEPIEDRGAIQSIRLAERQFGNRWIDPKITQESIQLRLKAGETLLPSLNDMSRMYNVSNRHN